MTARRLWLAAAMALVAALAVAGCGRTARDAGGETATLPETTPVASTIGASVADPAPPATTAGPSSAPDATLTDTGDAGGEARVADIAAASIEQQGGTLTVRIELAKPLDASALAADEQVAVGAYLLASPDDLEPYAARLLIDGRESPRFLFGPWLGRGTAIDGRLDGTALTLTVPGLDQGRFRYAQFFAEDPGGGETLPDDDAGVVAINAR